ncbi:hypothetical protein [Variovorax sp. JS1663]|uniref:hypothetical protein n=1 Tax=Variovorax sp. JS1663 TaxID=1851577 RepID=UPI000B349932|nr:hypothetical protein [Variovorax sp. JS1663]OUM00843.1 hypothetical protein A8M77_19320 [Variovorax sp. JS1663]
MQPVFLVRGLGAAALLLSLAACGGGDSGFDAGALGATATGNQAPAAQKPAGATTGASTADESSSSPTRWAP